MDEIFTKRGRAAIRRLFRYPEGPLVLKWMKLLYQDYKFQPILESNLQQKELTLAYQAGKSDLVTELTNIAEHGFTEDGGNDYAGDGEERGFEFDGEPGESREPGESGQTDVDE